MPKDGDGFVCDDQGRAIINVGAENYDDIFSPYCNIEIVEFEPY